MTSRRDMDELQQQIQELFSDLWQVPRFSGLRHGFRPQADCYRTEDPPELHVVVELPGVDPEQVQVVASDRAVVISGVRERPQVPGARIQQLELEYGAFQRRIQLTEDVDSGRAGASYERGLLHIVLPVAEPPSQHVNVSIEVRRSG
ncbi:MAG: Hsp20/alpha crystallin family protein [Gaiellaceae bacterium]